MRILLGIHQPVFAAWRVGGTHRQDDPYNGRTQALPERANDGQYTGCAAAALTGHVREHLPIVGALEESEADTTEQFTPTNLQRPGRVG